MKITNSINGKNSKTKKNIFKSNKPIVTNILITINIAIYIYGILFTNYDTFINMMCIHGPSIRAGQYYRLLSGIFTHGGITHLLFNCYALYIIGSQIEKLNRKLKYTIIYLFSGLIGALFSMSFGGHYASVGASGAIFGLMGSLLYFEYHYRTYLGNIVKSQILPLIFINLLIGFISPGIDNSAHIGGLIGGIIITNALGINNNRTTFEKVNGWIITLAFLAFISYIAFVYTT